MSCCYPQSWRVYGPQDRSRHGLQQVLDGVDVGVGQFKALDVGLGDSRVDQPRSPQGHPHPSGEEQDQLSRCSGWQGVGSEHQEFLKTDSSLSSFPFQFSYFLTPFLPITIFFSLYMDPSL